MQADGVQSGQEPGHKVCFSVRLVQVHSAAAWSEPEFRLQLFYLNEG